MTRMVTAGNHGLSVLPIPQTSIGLIAYHSAKSKLDDRMEEAASEKANLLNHMITGMLEAEVKAVDTR